MFNPLTKTWNVTYEYSTNIELDIEIQAIINTYKFKGDLINPPEYPYVEQLIIKLGDIDITNEICDHTKVRLEDDVLQNYLTSTEKLEY